MREGEGRKERNCRPRKPLGGRGSYQVQVMEA